MTKPTSPICRAFCTCRRYSYSNVARPVYSVECPVKLCGTMHSFMWSTFHHFPCCHLGRVEHAQFEALLVATNHRILECLHRCRQVPAGALASAPASCLHTGRLVLTDDLQDASLYSVHNSVSHCLRSVGYHLPTQVQSIPVKNVHVIDAHGMPTQS